jgi:hypothetical protein
LSETGKKFARLALNVSPTTAADMKSGASPAVLSSAFLSAQFHVLFAIGLAEGDILCELGCISYKFFKKSLSVFSVGEMVDEVVPVYFPTKVFQIILIVIKIARR